MSSFKNKIVLITGGASGIGRLTGIEVLKRGASRLIVVDVNEEALKTLPGEEGFPEEKVSVYAADISDCGEAEAVCMNILENEGTVDILFNNAGIVEGGYFSEQPLSVIRKTVEVNTLGCMYMARAFLPAMIEQGSGHIINIASAAGLMPNPGMAAYAGSKWAAVGWSESLRLELEQSGAGVQVLTVTPGYIDTGMFEGVKSPLLTPMLKQERITAKIIQAVEKNKARLREPFMVKLTPFLRGILPAAVFDFIAGRIFKVYESMSTFRGRA